MSSVVVLLRSTVGLVGDQFAGVVMIFVLPSPTQVHDVCASTTSDDAAIRHAVTSRLEWNRMGLDELLARTMPTGKSRSITVNRNFKTKNAEGTSPSLR